MIDQWGKTAIDSRLSGYEITISMTLAEITNKANWKVAFPSLYEVTTGSQSFYGTMQVGDSLLARAQLLTLHPLEAAPGVVTGDYTFWKAAVKSVKEVKYGPEKQVGLAVEFVVYPDTTVNPPRFFLYGDTTIGITNASAGSATAGSNTGNGTITAITVSNGVTKTETITVTCVGASSGNDFYVSGSLSGALGECHVNSASGSTVNFSVQSGSPAVLTFTLNQAGTQWVKGDSYTIATTAANYA
jgi:hypothetical protein